MITQILVNGMIAGSLYVLAGISFGFIYTSTGVFHFAHLTAYTIGGFGFYQMVVSWQQPLILSLVVGIGLASFIGVLIEWVCYRPLREHQASGLQVFLTSIGVTLVLQNIFLLIWKSDPQVVPIHEELLMGRQVGGIWLTYFQAITMCTVASLWGILHLFMVKSKVGKAIRAFAADPETAEIMGIDTRWLRLIIYSIGSALIAVVAQLQIMDLGIDINAGLDIVIIGVIASLIGGRRGINGIAIASLALGLIENTGMIILSAQWKYIILFGTVIVLLYLQPKGIFKTP